MLILLRKTAGLLLPVLKKSWKLLVPVLIFLATLVYITHLRNTISHERDISATLVEKVGQLEADMEILNHTNSCVIDYADKLVKIPHIKPESFKEEYNQLVKGWNNHD